MPAQRDKSFWKKLLVWPNLFGLALWAVTQIVYPLPREYWLLQAALFSISVAFNALLWFKEIRWMIYLSIIGGVLDLVTYPLKWMPMSMFSPQQTLAGDLLYLALSGLSVAGGLGFLRCIEVAKRVPPRLIDPDP